MTMNLLNMNMSMLYKNFMYILFQQKTSRVIGQPVIIRIRTVAMLILYRYVIYLRIDFFINCCSKTVAVEAAIRIFLKELPVC